jgi:UDP-glucose 4-epimerase
MKKLLITGGAGYIGSHTLLEALNSHYEVLVIDSLERGYKESLERVEQLSGKKVRFEKVDIRNKEEINKALQSFNPEVVIHFAAYKSVGEGQQFPEKYYENNVHATELLLQSMVENSVKRIIFSSSAAVYGMSDQLPITESSPTNPISVYGETKLEMEKLIDRYSKEHGLESVAFRYFNAVGAHESGMLGEDPRSSTNLLPLVMQTLTGRRKEVQLFGNKFNTEDGSQERDYIHVSDLAIAHIKAAEIDLPEGNMLILNLSTGRSTSCLKVFKISEDVSGKKLNYTVVSPREGDPEILYADNSKAKEILKWEPVRDIRKSIEDQWLWTKNNPDGYKY